MNQNKAEWASLEQRQKFVQEITTYRSQFGNPTSNDRSSVEIETQIYQKAQSREEYMNLIARLLIHLKDVMGAPNNMGNVAASQKGIVPQVVNAGLSQQLVGHDDQTQIQIQGQQRVQMLQVSTAQLQQPQILQANTGMTALSKAGMQKLMTSAGTIHLGTQLPAGNVSFVTNPQRLQVGGQLSGLNVHQAYASRPDPSPLSNTGPVAQSPLPTQPSPSPAAATPGNPPSLGGPVQSPLDASDESAYAEKLKELAKYTEPLRSLINKMPKDGEHAIKRKKLVHIDEVFSNKRRVSLAFLAKCEQVVHALLSADTTTTVKPGILQAVTDHLVPLSTNPSLSKKPGIPSIPPLVIKVPACYPKRTPEYSSSSAENSDSLLLGEVRKNFLARLLESQKEQFHSVTCILEAWEQSLTETLNA
eukprot:Seg6202.1 transcript_id=Seg6202.1/GoldUCD/mRNA.D3Y31 product="Mediator of RNA polymerase II transcription subunit 15" protein_id=Seg6202.1/GoldUCD/D3Y31